MATPLATPFRRGRTRAAGACSPEGVFAPLAPLRLAEVLGAELVGDREGVAMYRFGEKQLNVHGPGLEPDPVAQLPVHPGKSDLCFHWPGPIEDAIDHLRTHYVEVELGSVRRRGARGEGTSVYFRDPTAACSN